MAAAMAPARENGSAEPGAAVQLHWKRTYGFFNRRRAAWKQEEKEHGVAYFMLDAQQPDILRCAHPIPDLLRCALSHAAWAAL